MDQKEIEERAKKIEESYNNYLAKIAKLKKEQNKILEDFIHELEKAKIEELRSKLN
ncbi:MAG: hypothetical protein WC906_04280 [Parcubacteria group bacterium]|jgi:hypothetical protein